MLNLVLWMLAGAFIGWLASIVMRTNAQQGIFLNIIVGITGAFLGGFLLNFMGFNTSNINNNDFSLSSIAVSFIGAILLLAVINIIRRGILR